MSFNCKRLFSLETLIREVVEECLREEHKPKPYEVAAYKIGKNNKMRSEGLGIPTKTKQFKTFKQAEKQFYEWLDEDHQVTLTKYNKKGDGDIKREEGPVDYESDDDGEFNPECEICGDYMSNVEEEDYVFGANCVCAKCGE